MPQTLAAIPAIVAAAGAGGAAAGGAATVGGLFASGALATVAGGTAVTFGTVGGLSIGGLLASTAISLALSTAGNLITRALAGSGQPRQTSQAQQATFAEPESERFFYAGRVKTGGQLGFVEEEAGSAGRLCRAIITDCGPSDAIESHLLNNETLTLGPTGLVQNPNKWDGKVAIFERLGDPDQDAMAELISSFPGLWTDQHRLRGLTYVLVRQAPVASSAVLATYPNGARGEQYTQVRRAAKDIYDPRTQTTGWTRNAALVVMWALRHPWFGAIPLDEFNVDPAAAGNWLAAADECDVTILDVEGVEQAQWTLSGRIQVPQPGRQATEVVGTIAEMLACFDAEIYEDPETEGKLSIRIGAPDPIEDGPFGVEHILSWEDEETPGLLEGYDAVRIRYVEPRIGYIEKMTPTWGVFAPQSVLPINRAWIDNYSQAQRIAKRTYLRSRGRRAKCSVNLAGLLLPVGSGMEIDLPILPPGETYRVLDREIAFGGDGEVGVQLALESVDPAHNQWDRLTEEQVLQLPPVLDTRGAIVVPPAGVRAAADQAADGTVRVVWDAVTAAGGVAAELEWSNAGAGSWGNRITVPSAAAREALLNAAAAPGLIDIRMRFVDEAGQTAWTTVAGIDPDVPLAQQAAPSFTAGTWSGSQGGGSPFIVDPGLPEGTWKITITSSTGLKNASKVPDAVDAEGPHSFNLGGDPGTQTEWSLRARTTNISGRLSPLKTITYNQGV